MENTCDRFIERLIKTSDCLQSIRQETVAYWAPDPPPVTILFAAIGKELARHFDVMENESRKNAFYFIEEGINSSDNVLKTAVAAGIIEGLVSKSSRIEGLWPRIESQLGSKSRRHAESWRSTNF